MFMCVRERDTKRGRASVCVGGCVFIHLFLCGLHIYVSLLQVILYCIFALKHQQEGILAEE